jgi:hypothetical protein
MSGCQRSPGSVNSSHRGELVGRPAMSTSKNSGSESTRAWFPVRSGSRFHLQASVWSVACDALSSA